MTMNSDFRITETNKFTASNPLYITNENSNESLEFDPSSASTNQKECSSTGHSISSKLRHSIQNYPVCWIFGTLTTLCISIAIVVLCVILIKHSRTTSSPPTLANQLLVETTAGLIHGFYLPYKSSITGDVINITAFRGVPFARSPIEGLRWQPPIPPTPWNSTLMTLEFREPCVQPLGDPMNTGSEGSEDCLYLNVYVYRPPTASSQSLLPVLFYIHGGGMMAGWGGEDMTPFLANAGYGEQGGMVLVQVNYRVNLFGFLAMKQLSNTSANGVSGNYGIQDQILALQWVQQNIQAFGGNPSSVTIAGQSSGGTSCFALLASPMSKGLYASAISLSGSPNITTSLTKAETQNANIFSNSSCQKYAAAPATSQFVNCIRSLPASKIQYLIPNDWNTPGMWGMPYRGQYYDAVVIVDGITVTQSFETALSMGINNVPILFGNMAFEPDEDPDNIVANYSSQQWWYFLNTSFVSFDTFYMKPNGTAGTQMYKLYQNESIINPQMAYDAIVSDYGLTCASPILAQFGLPPKGLFENRIYTYVNEWGLSYPYEVPGLNGYISRYAHHDVDFWMLTESWSVIGNGTYVPSKRDILGSRYLQTLWYQFMTLNGLLSESSFYKAWLPTSSCSGFPSCYNTFVIRPPNATISESFNVSQFEVVSSSVSMLNYKQEGCDYFASIGIDNEAYWWCN